MNETTAGEPFDLSRLTCEIVVAYVSSNHVARGDLAALITNVHAALSGLSNIDDAKSEKIEDRKTPAQVRNSITRDALISFIDGKLYKTLKRHLSTHGFDPDGYRVRYGLPGDYPMVAPSYSERRSNISRASGLGRAKGRQIQAEPPAESVKPAKRGRPKRT